MRKYSKTKLGIGNAQGNLKQKSNDSNFARPKPPLKMRRETVGSQAMRRVFSIFSFSALPELERKVDPDEDMLAFENSTIGDGESDSVLSDKSATTKDTVSEAEEVRDSHVGAVRQEETNFWGEFVDLGYSINATVFLYMLMTQPERRRIMRAKSQPRSGTDLLSRQHSRRGTVDNGTNPVESTKPLSFLLQKSGRETLSRPDVTYELSFGDTEVLKLDMFSVLNRTSLGRSPCVILTDLLWAAFGLQHSNAVRVSEAHLILRFYFDLAYKNRTTELMFQVLDTTKTGVLNLREVNDFIAQACSQSINVIASIPAAATLFKRYLRSLGIVDMFGCYLMLYPYVKRNKNNGYLSTTRAIKIYKLYFNKDSGFSLDFPNEIVLPIQSYFEKVLGEPEQTIVAFDNFLDAFKYIKNILEKKHLNNFIKKARHSNRLATRVFNDIGTVPIPGLNLTQFEKLLDVYEPLRQHCERCSSILKQVAQHFDNNMIGNREIDLNDINEFQLKRRIPL